MEKCPAPQTYLETEPQLLLPALKAEDKAKELKAETFYWGKQLLNFPKGFCRRQRRIIHPQGILVTVQSSSVIQDTLLIIRASRLLHRPQGAGKLHTQPTENHKAALLLAEKALFWSCTASSHPYS